MDVRVVDAQLFDSGFSHAYLPNEGVINRTPSIDAFLRRGSTGGVFKPSSYGDVSMIRKEPNGTLQSHEYCPKDTRQLTDEPGVNTSPLGPIKLIDDHYGVGA